MFNCALKEDSVTIKESLQICKNGSLCRNMLLQLIIQIVSGEENWDYYRKHYEGI